MAKFKQRINEYASVLPSGFTGVIVENSNVILDKNYIEKGTTFTNAFDNSNVILKDCGSANPKAIDNSEAMNQLRNKLENEIDRSLLPFWAHYTLKRKNINDISENNEIYLAVISNQTSANSDLAYTVPSSIKKIRESVEAEATANGQETNEYTVSLSASLAYKITENGYNTYDVDYTLAGKYVIANAASSIKHVYPLNSLSLTSEDRPALLINFKERLFTPMQIGAHRIEIKDTILQDSLGNNVVIAGQGAYVYASNGKKLAKTLNNKPQVAKTIDDDGNVTLLYQSVNIDDDGNVKMPVHFNEKNASWIYDTFFTTNTVAYNQTDLNNQVIGIKNGTNSDLVDFYFQYNNRTFSVAHILSQPSSLMDINGNEVSEDDRETLYNSYLMSGTIVSGTDDSGNPIKNINHILNMTSGSTYYVVNSTLSSTSLYSPLSPAGYSNVKLKSRFLGFSYDTSGVGCNDPYMLYTDKTGTPVSYPYPSLASGNVYSTTPNSTTLYFKNLNKEIILNKNITSEELFNEFGITPIKYSKRVSTCTTNFSKTIIYEEDFTYTPETDSTSSDDGESTKTIRLRYSNTVSKSITTSITESGYTKWSENPEKYTPNQSTIIESISSSELTISTSLPLIISSKPSDMSESTWSTISKTKNVTDTYDISKDVTSTSVDDTAFNSTEAWKYSYGSVTYSNLAYVDSLENINSNYKRYKIKAKYSPESNIGSTPSTTKYPSGSIFEESNITYHNDVICTQDESFYLILSELNDKVYYDNKILYVQPGIELTTNILKKTNIGGTVIRLIEYNDGNSKFDVFEESPSLFIPLYYDSSCSIPLEVSEYSNNGSYEILAHDTSGRKYFEFDENGNIAGLTDGKSYISYEYRKLNEYEWRTEKNYHLAYDKDWFNANTYLKFNESFLDIVPEVSIKADFYTEGDKKNINSDCFTQNIYYPTSIALSGDVVSGLFMRDNSADSKYKMFSFNFNIPSAEWGRLSRDMYANNSNYLRKLDLDDDNKNDFYYGSESPSTTNFYFSIPEFKIKLGTRRYLGPSGIYVQNDDSNILSLQGERNGDRVKLYTLDRSLIFNFDLTQQSTEEIGGMTGWSISNMSTYAWESDCKIFENKTFDKIETLKDLKHGDIISIEANPVLKGFAAKAGITKVMILEFPKKSNFPSWLPNSWFVNKPSKKLSNGKIADKYNDEEEYVRVPVCKFLFKDASTGDIWMPRGCIYWLFNRKNTIKSTMYDKDVLSQDYNPNLTNDDIEYFRDCFNDNDVTTAVLHHHRHYLTKLTGFEAAKLVKETTWYNQRLKYVTDADNGLRLALKVESENLTDTSGENDREIANTIYITICDPEAKNVYYDFPKSGSLIGDSKPSAKCIPNFLIVDGLHCLHEYATETDDLTGENRYDTTSGGIYAYNLMNADDISFSEDGEHYEDILIIDLPKNTVSILDNEPLVRPHDISTNLLYYTTSNNPEKIGSDDDVLIVNARKMYSEVDTTDTVPKPGFLTYNLSGLATTSMTLTAYIPVNEDGTCDSISDYNVYVNPTTNEYSNTPKAGYYPCRYTDTARNGSQYILKKVNDGVIFYTSDDQVIEAIPSIEPNSNFLDETIEVPAKLGFTFRDLLLQFHVRDVVEFDNIDNITAQKRYYTNDGTLPLSLSRNGNSYVVLEELSGNANTVYKCQNWIKRCPNIALLGNSDYCLDTSSLNTITNNASKWKTVTHLNQYDDLRPFTNYNPLNNIIGTPYCNILRKQIVKDEWVEYNTYGEKTGTEEKSVFGAIYTQAYDDSYVNWENAIEDTTYTDLDESFYSISGNIFQKTFSNGVTTTRAIIKGTLNDVDYTGYASVPLTVIDLDGNPVKGDYNNAKNIIKIAFTGYTSSKEVKLENASFLIAPNTYLEAIDSSDVSLDEDGNVYGVIEFVLNNVKNDTNGKLRLSTFQPPSPTLKSVSIYNRNDYENIAVEGYYAVDNNRWQREIALSGLTTNVEQKLFYINQEGSALNGKSYPDYDNEGNLIGFVLKLEVPFIKQFDKALSAKIDLQDIKEYTFESEADITAYKKSLIWLSDDDTYKVKVPYIGGNYLSGIVQTIHNYVVTKGINKRVNNVGRYRYNYNPTDGDKFQLEVYHGKNVNGNINWRRNLFYINQPVGSWYNMSIYNWTKEDTSSASNSFSTGFGLQLDRLSGETLKDIDSRGNSVFSIYVADDSTTYGAKAHFTWQNLTSNEAKLSSVLFPGAGKYMYNYKALYDSEFDKCSRWMLTNHYITDDSVLALESDIHSLTTAERNRRSQYDLRNIGNVVFNEDANRVNIQKAGTMYLFDNSHVSELLNNLDNKFIISGTINDNSAGNSKEFIEMMLNDYYPVSFKTPTEAADPMSLFAWQDSKQNIVYTDTDKPAVGMLTCDELGTYSNVIKVDEKTETSITCSGIKYDRYATADKKSSKFLSVENENLNYILRKKDKHIYVNDIRISAKNIMLVETPSLRADLDGDTADTAYYISKYESLDAVKKYDTFFSNPQNRLPAVSYTHRVLDSDYATMIYNNCEKYEAVYQENDKALVSIIYEYSLNPSFIGYVWGNSQVTRNETATSMDGYTYNYLYWNRYAFNEYYSEPGSLYNYRDASHTTTVTVETTSVTERQCALMPVLGNPLISEKRSNNQVLIRNNEAIIATAALGYSINGSPMNGIMKYDSEDDYAIIDSTNTAYVYLEQNNNSSECMLSATLQKPVYLESVTQNTESLAEKFEFLEYPDINLSLRDVDAGVNTVLGGNTDSWSDAFNAALFCVGTSTSTEEFDGTYYSIAAAKINYSWYNYDDDIVYSTISLNTNRQVDLKYFANVTSFGYNKNNGSTLIKQINVFTPAERLEKEREMNDVGGDSAILNGIITAPVFTYDGSLIPSNAFSITNDSYGNQLEPEEQSASDDVRNLYNTYLAKVKKISLSGVLPFEPEFGVTWYNAALGAESAYKLIKNKNLDELRNNRHAIFDQYNFVNVTGVKIIINEDEVGSAPVKIEIRMLKVDPNSNSLKWIHDDAFDIDLTDPDEPNYYENLYSYQNSGDKVIEKQFVSREDDELLKHILGIKFRIVQIVPQQNTTNAARIGKIQIFASNILNSVGLAKAVEDVYVRNIDAGYGNAYKINYGEYVWHLPNAIDQWEAVEEILQETSTSDTEKGTIQKYVTKMKDAYKNKKLSINEYLDDDGTNFSHVATYYITDRNTFTSDIRDCFSDNYLADSAIKVTWKYVDYVYVSYSCYSPNAKELLDLYFGDKIYAAVRAKLIENVNNLNVNSSLKKERVKGGIAVIKENKVNTTYNSQMYEYTNKYNKDTTTIWEDTYKATEGRSNIGGYSYSEVRTGSKITDQTSVTNFLGTTMTNAKFTSVEKWMSEFTPRQIKYKIN